jgi:aminomethyltransferase
MVDDTADVSAPASAEEAVAPAGAGGAALLHSPLHNRHVALGAKFAAFGGWSMPLEYPSGVVKEHTAVREAVGVFDVSHLGKLMVTGPGAAAYVNTTLTNDLGRIRHGKAQYTLCCDTETGGIVDDLIAYFHDDEHVLLVPNAANSAEVARRLAAQAPSGVKVLDHHRQYAVLAVQGTRSDEVLDALGLPSGHEYMSFEEAEFEDTGVVVCRTGYTGERGYELIARNEVAGTLWDRLLDAGQTLGIAPCGLGARDTLRTEMGYPLHGQDITIDVTPNQARLGWAVGWKKDAFWGRDALVREKEAGPQRVLRGLLALERGIPRPGMLVSLTADVPLCEITSGTFSPTLRKGIGMALVPSFVDPEAELGVQIRTRREIFSSAKLPFVDTSVRES